MITREIREREMFRRDFSNQFLKDYQAQLFDKGRDPRNFIGRKFGHNHPRTLQIWHDRAIGGMA